VEARDEQRAELLAQRNGRGLLRRRLLVLAAAAAGDDEQEDER
jgi:hypothetical protein